MESLQVNTDLWTKIMLFDLDHPVSDYCFSIRLAKENCWSKSFTEKAILEYKKFMYLAATADEMVSPSEIVDIVWHQHLIFSKSYKEFCAEIGKYIQHIPSTHNKDKAVKFKECRTRTLKLYMQTFGEQPKDIWASTDMFVPLGLKKASFRIRSFVLLAVLAFLLLAFPLYLFLRPIYVQIYNPYFMWGYLSLIALSLIGLEKFNKTALMQLLREEFKGFSFIYHLQPFELVYFKTERLEEVIKGHLHKLLEENRISIIDKTKFACEGEVRPLDTPETFTIIDTLQTSGAMEYPQLIRQLSRQPVFQNVANLGDAFKKYFNGSQAFSNLFYINFTVLYGVWMLGLIRLITGLLRDKPVALLLITLLALLFITIFYLSRLHTVMSRTLIPALYKTKLLPAREGADSWDWRYFKLGPAVLTASLLSVAAKYNNSSTWSSGGVDSSSSSSDSGGSSGCGGSSCSSCGGCGGGGD